MSNSKIGSNVSVGQLDRAIAAARRRTEERQKEGAARPGGSPRGSTAERPQRARLTPEERAARDLKRDAERSAAKAERDRARDERRAAREAQRAQPHLAKVQKAEARLPKLTERAAAVFRDITVNLTGAEASSLALHLNHHNRASATQRAVGLKLEEGMQVRITGGDPRFIGQEGTVVRAQRIRCYVEVPGTKKPVYLLISEVERTGAAAPAAAAGA